MRETLAMTISHRYFYCSSPHHHSTCETIFDHASFRVHRTERSLDAESLMLCTEIMRVEQIVSLSTVTQLMGDQKVRTRSSQRIQESSWSYHLPVGCRQSVIVRFVNLGGLPFSSLCPDNLEIRCYHIRCSP